MSLRIQLCHQNPTKIMKYCTLLNSVIIDYYANQIENHFKMGTFALNVSPLTSINII